MNLLYLAAAAAIVIGLYLHFTLPDVQDPVQFQQAAMRRKRWGMVLIVAGLAIGAYGYFTSDRQKATMARGGRKCQWLVEEGDDYKWRYGMGPTLAKCRDNCGRATRVNCVASRLGTADEIDY